MGTQEDRLQKLEQKALEADARFRKAKREAAEEKRKVRTRCNIIAGAAMISAIKGEDPALSNELLSLLEKYTSQKDLKFLNDNMGSLL